MAETNNSAIKLKCEQALTACRLGNHTESLQMINEACQRYENHALVHRYQATICVKIATTTDDQTAKQWYINNAIESAQKAYTLSPNSIEFSHFYANLLYEAAQYEKVVEECERALEIENPADPEIAEGLKQELKSLIQKANIASISTWMKNFEKGNGGEKLRLVPITSHLKKETSVCCCAELSSLKDPRNNL